MASRGLPRKPLPPQRSAPRKSGRRRGNPFGLIAFTLALPLFAFGAWLAFQKFTGRDVPSVAELQDVVVEQTRDESPVATILGRAGLKATRGNGGKRLVVATSESPDAIARRIRKNSGDAEVLVKGNVLEVTSAAGRELVEIQRPAVSPAAEKPVDVVEDRIKSASSRVPGGRGRIVLILDDIGYRKDLLLRASKIDREITFAIIPEAPQSAEAASFLTAGGFETMCHLPMEPVGYPKMSPGSEAVLTSMTDQQIREMTSSNLRKLPGISGVNNHMGSRATADSRVMKQVLSVVKPTGLFFIDSKTISGSLGASLARRLGIPTASRDVFLDDDPSEKAIEEQLRKLVEIADRDGVSIGIGHLYPSTIRVLENHIPRLKQSGITLLRASEVVR